MQGGRDRVPGVLGVHRASPELLHHSPAGAAAAGAKGQRSVVAAAPGGTLQAVSALPPGPSGGGPFLAVRLGELQLRGLLSGLGLWVHRASEAVSCEWCLEGAKGVVWASLRSRGAGALPLFLRPCFEIVNRPGHQTLGTEDSSRWQEQFCACPVPGVAGSGGVSPGTSLALPR